MGKKFDGMYYKHQKNENTVSLIAGISAGNHSFIQAITNNESYYFRYPLPVYESGERLKIGSNLFSKDGVMINIEENGVSMHGEIRYSELTPIRYDIMGPFKYLPMQCRHTVSSLHHRLDGSLTINGKAIDFTDGLGYIEGDLGVSFPKSYTWIQCNDFPGKACIMASTADIPFAGFSFRGCICVVYIHGREYRLATYLGVKILCCDERLIILEQGRYCLEIEIEEGIGHRLMAPEKGKMVREIRERISCGASFRFMENGKALFEGYSKNASFEFVRAD